MVESLINKYRPETFEEVVGHEKQVRALENAVKQKLATSFLLTGGSGLGKTTLARIVASEVGCKPGDLLEIDAATHTGIDAMREVMSTLMYKPLGDGSVKAVIVDECHALSKQAWQSLLKILEQPPSWVYWFLCTTDPARVPKTIQTRCHWVDLKPVPKKALVGLLQDVVKGEKLKVPPSVIDLCAEEAQGSPRQALSNLVACAVAKDVDEAAELLNSVVESAEAIDLARMLIRGARWSEVQELLKGFKDSDPESIRRVIMAYMTTVVLSSKREQDAGRGLEILDAFSQPFYQNGHLVLACGKVLLS